MKILVVDDSKAMRMIIRRTLRQAGFGDHAITEATNGKEALDSRSLNTFYLRPRFIVGDLDHWFLVMVPEIWTYIGDVEDNPQIKDYRGYGKLRFYLGKNTGPSLRVTLWSGEDFDNGSYELDLTIPIKTQLLSLETFFHVQYFNGYGESLLDYNRKLDSQLRLGISIAL